ncbi:MAG: RNA 2',3'-cyclic phosphodiesterase, partial [Candidatus Pacearchaeota archaeon]|nr:RNA 2',3'-cyclic phosphodiesterase [Candidatus Pacearchaeota archaeon]
IWKRQIMRIQENLPEFMGKITEPENLHLTLKFLGDIGEEKLALVEDILRKIKFKEFEMTIDSLGIFSSGNPRIVWLGSSGSSLLQEKIDESLFPVDSKEQRFMEHLTIARVKSVKNKREFLQKLKDIKIHRMEFHVKEFYLEESVLLSKGPRYKVLGRYPLV